VSVCPSVSLSARKSQKSHTSNFYDIFPYTVAAAPSFSDDIAMCYVLPVLWSMSMSMMDYIKVRPKADE